MGLRTFVTPFIRLALVSTILFGTVEISSAYTIVMRGGRRVEIPDQFKVTQVTLTYEVGTGLLVTLQTAAIDIAATERANNEAPGAFAVRASRVEKLPPATPAEVQKKATRSITNSQLEPYARNRRESELLYERRRNELGLPSAAETQAQAASGSQAFEEELSRRRERENESEIYWRSRASALRAEIAATDAELNYLQQRIGDTSLIYPSFTVVSSVLPFGRLGQGNLGFGPSRIRSGNFERPSVFVAPATRQVGRGIRGQVFLNPNTRSGVRPFHVAPPVRPLGGLTAFSGPLDAYGASYERSALLMRIQELGSLRAGLNARWQELENEARRAGAQPGWLRP